MLEFYVDAIELLNRPAGFEVDKKPAVKHWGPLRLPHANRPRRWLRLPMLRRALAHR